MKIKRQLDQLSSVTAKEFDIIHEDGHSVLDEEILQIIAEPTAAELRYEELVIRGEIEQVDWNYPISVLRYCHTMYQIRLEIYGDSCPLHLSP